MVKAGLERLGRVHRHLDQGAVSVHESIIHHIVLPNDYLNL